MRKSSNSLIIVLSITVVILLAFVIGQNTGLLDQSVFKKTAEDVADTSTLDTTIPQQTAMTGHTTVEAEAGSSIPADTSDKKTTSESTGMIPDDDQTEKTGTTTATGTGKQDNAPVGEEEETNKDTTKEDAESQVWSTMHKMVNTKIVADAIWGRIEITEEEVKKVEDIVTKSDFSDKDKLLEILADWKNGDFSKAVEQHNYLWGKLGGTIGKATGLADK